MSTLPACLPAPPLFRQRLEAVRGQLLELDGACPELGLDVALDTIEVTLRGLGWTWPEPLSEHDLKVLASLGCPASD